MGMKCQSCGRENVEGSSFCSVCGNPIVVGGSHAAKAIQQPIGQQAVKKSNTGLIVAIVVIVVVAIVIVGAFVAMTAVNDATTTSVSISVANAKEVVDPFFSPSAGNTFVQLDVTMKNNERSTITLNPYEFKVLTTNGSSYSYTWLIDNTVPDALAAGSTVTFSIAFEVPAGIALTKLTYQALLSTNLVEASIGSVSPAVISITLSVTSATDSTGLYPPSSGNKYVMVNFTMTNGYSSSLSLSPYDFNLRTSNGTIYDYSWAVTDNIPAGLAAGASYSMSIGFEIPISTSAQKLIFESGNLHVEATVP
jgi:hypothetical protein